MVGFKLQSKGAHGSCRFWPRFLDGDKMGIADQEGTQSSDSILFKGVNKETDLTTVTLQNVLKPGNAKPWVLFFLIKTGLTTHESL